LDSDVSLDTIMAWTQDLFLLPRLQDVARALGYDIEVVDSPAQLNAGGEATGRPVPLTEPLEGADGRMLEYITTLRPVLILVDTTAIAIPWRRWIHVLKTSAATRRIPILAFGPHVDEANLELARTAGADKVVTRGQFQSGLPKLIGAWARPSMAEALVSACEGALSPAAELGVHYHNKGSYFEAHEALESAWKAAPEAEGTLYRALLQVSVAYYHVQEGNHRGASKMMLRVRQWLDPLPDTCRSIDIRKLREQVEDLRRALAGLSPDTIDQLDRGLLRPFPRSEA
jgi:predicted metal-dependent hydrolase